MRLASRAPLFSEGCPPMVSFQEAGMTKDSEITALSFEDALVELERIVELLERGDVALEESIRIYERGANLKAHCLKKLQSAKLKVEQIVLNQNGEPETREASFES